MKIVFIVLTYRNTQDIKAFIKSVSEKVKVSYKIIIVNSEYDEESKNCIEEIAKKNNCDFINVENKGYGSGNNAGIEFAQEKYDYEFAIICNPDVEILNFDYDKLEQRKFDVVAPKIITLNGRNQNPFRLIDSSLLDLLKYKSVMKNKKIFIYIDIIINKLLKILFFKFKSKNKTIYSCHGSFLIISKSAINKMHPIYNERMFLLAEEDHFAKLAKCKGIKIYYDDEISILHKEDGSMKFVNDKINDLLKESYSTYYETWYKGNSESYIKYNEF